MSKSTNTSALDPYKSFGIEVDPQELVTPLIVEIPYLMEHEGTTVSALSYAPEKETEASEALETGHYRLQIQAVIHHQDHIAAFKHNEKFQGFISPVTYAPETLISHLVDQIGQEVQLSTGIDPMLRKIEHHDMGFVLLHGDEDDLLLNAHLHVDEIKQEITLTIPLLMENDPGDSMALDACTLDFQEDIEWTANPELLHPALRSYLFDVDASAVNEDAFLC